MTFELAIFARGTMHRATGQVVWVCAGVGDHASRPIPDDMRARFEALNGETPIEVDPVRI